MGGWRKEKKGKKKRQGEAEQTLEIGENKETLWVSFTDVTSLSVRSWVFFSSEYICGLKIMFGGLTHERAADESDRGEKEHSRLVSISGQTAAAFQWNLMS